MTTTPDPVPAKKPAKIRIEPIQTKDIVDVWRLFESRLRTGPKDYPSLDEDNPEDIRANIYQMMISPQFIGFIAKQGRKPVAHVLSMINQRPFGSPRVFLLTGIFWVEPEYRKTGIGQDLVKALFTKAKAMGVHHFEAWTDVALTETFVKLSGGKGKVVSHRIGGKITLE